MRILIFNWKDLAHRAAGGAEVFTDEVARRWAAAGHEVTLFAAAVAGCPARETIGGVHIVRAGSRLGVYRAARRFYETQGRGSYDVVIDEVNTRPFGCATWVHDAPVVALIHQVCREIWFYETPWPIALVGRYVLEPRWLRAYRDIPVVTVSPSSRESLERYGLRDITVVPEGIGSMSRPDVAKEQRPTVAFVGRLVASKRPHDVVRAFRIVREKLPDAQLWIVGDGPMRDKLDTKDGVRVFGRVSRMERDELLARAHVLAVTSVREGWALVVDEAAAMGTPTVGYARPGLVDSVPAAGGVLVDSRPSALADALIERLPTWAAQGSNASRPQGWSGGAVDWDVVAERCLEAVQSAMDGRNRMLDATGHADEVLTSFEVS